MDQNISEAAPDGGRIFNSYGHLPHASQDLEVPTGSSSNGNRWLSLALAGSRWPPASPDDGFATQVRLTQDGTAVNRAEGADAKKKKKKRERLQGLTNLLNY